MPRNVQFSFTAAKVQKTKKSDRFFFHFLGMVYSPEKERVPLPFPHFRNDNFQFYSFSGIPHVTTHNHLTLHANANDVVSSPVCELTSFFPIILYLFMCD